ncbi:hypothetical protein TP47_00345 (plasmid) [Xanthomonas citri pv. aurantifolii]|nr:hypothetical protein TP37_10710 [Xanthomonas citri pv. aurantifolii]AMV03398.1 hypothetical protein TP50_13875 [Xanthomonas citri pv. aurantifolii]TBW93181.1 hypothetical protein TP49_22275 [Xanthomonas citri pv. aurantifolii]TBX01910.1 hypothetical protein TP47_00345 [Xanthomonas citri pv. aurantifolii]TBX04630.1 hypothetical protein TP46_04365 [Xanthomonas citri pv. aurantifolii]
MSWRHVYHRVVIGAFIFHIGDAGKFRNDDIRIGRAFIAEFMHVLNKVILITNRFFRMLPFTCNPLRKENCPVDQLPFQIE